MKFSNMKKIVFLIQLLILIQFNNPLCGQDKKFKIQAGGILAQYLETKDYSDSDYPGYYNFPVSPGAELLFSAQIIHGLSIETGINFQTGKVSSFVEGAQRFHFTETSIPLLLKKGFTTNDKSFYFSAGAYLGKLTSVNYEYFTSFGWKEGTDQTEIAYYSDDKFLSDLYLDLGYSTPLSSKFDISFSPFFKYRINTTWLNHYHKKFHYGVKVNVSLKL